MTHRLDYVSGHDCASTSPRSRRTMDWHVMLCHRRLLSRRHPSIDFRRSCLNHLWVWWINHRRQHFICSTNDQIALKYYSTNQKPSQESITYTYLESELSMYSYLVCSLVSFYGSARHPFSWQLVSVSVRNDRFYKFSTDFNPILSPSLTLCNL